MSVSVNRLLNRRLRSLLSAGFFLYPLAMHLLIVRGMITAALAGLLLVSVAVSVLQLLDRRGWWLALPYLLIVVVALVCLGSDAKFALYLPPVIFNILLATVFGRTLRRTETPLIERFMHRYHAGVMSRIPAMFPRQLTFVWTAFFVICALAGAMLAAFASLEAWSLFANFINYLLVAALFLGQFVYVCLRYRALRLPEIVPIALRVMRGAGNTTLGR